MPHSLDKGTLTSPQSQPLALDRRSGTILNQVHHLLASVVAKYHVGNDPIIAPSNTSLFRPPRLRRPLRRATGKVLCPCCSSPPSPSSQVSTAQPRAVLLDLPTSISPVPQSTLSSDGDSRIVVLSLSPFLPVSLLLCPLKVFFAFSRLLLLYIYSAKVYQEGNGL
ncbi:hypothetical protein F4777DRAFT_377791 [Nemania sp. FL0916]|nr:hypothetical protein F4777DRAFT_377791 [Nemania sp. FL0916]